MSGMGKPLLEVSYLSDYEVDGQTTLRSLVFKWLWGGMGKSHIEVSYSSYYEVGWANHSYKSRIQVTIRWDGQITLRILVFKWLLGGMGKLL